MRKRFLATVPSPRCLHTRAARAVQLLLAALVLSLTLFATGNAPALAASAAHQDRLVAQITAPLNIDCSQVPNTPLAHNMLKKAGLCGYGKKQSGPTPDARVDGNCGSVILDLFDHGGGYMLWHGEITSTQGAFTSASYGGYYTPPQGLQQSVWRPMWSGLTSDWVDTFTPYVGTGRTYGAITSAVDVLWWLGVCTASDPVLDDTWVA